MFSAPGWPDVLITVVLATDTSALFSVFVEFLFELRNT
jgi:hypothetical protein